MPKYPKNDSERDDSLQREVDAFAHRLKTARHAMQMGQQELGQLLGVQRTTVSSWEKGETVPDIKTLLLLKQELRGRKAIDLGELLGEERAETSDTSLTLAVKLLTDFDQMGLRGVYHSRNEALLGFVPFLEQERRSIGVVSSSFLGVRTVAETRVSEVLKRKVTEVEDFRILLTHPDFSQWREAQEGRREDAIKREILQSVETLINDWGVSENCIRLYRGAPTIFLIFTEQRMLINPYTYQSEAFKTATFEVVRSANQSYDLFSQYHQNHFRAPWDSANAVTITEYEKHAAEKLTRTRREQ